MIVFGEKQDLKTRKALAAVTADFKINGILTAHNLWTKIVNFQKMGDEQETGSSGSKLSENSTPDSVFLKGGSSEDKKNLNKSNVLSNLFKALDNPNHEFDNEDVSMVGSSDATKYKKSSIAHMPTGDDDDVETKSSMSHISGSSSELKSSQSDSDRLDELGKTSDSLMDDDSDSMSSLKEDEDGAMGVHGKSSKEKATHAKGAKGSESEKENNEAELDAALDEALNASDNHDEDDRPKAGDQPTDDKSNSDNSSKAPNIEGKKKEKNPNSQNSDQDDEGSKNSDEEKPFGAVQLSDEDEVKEHQKKKDKEKGEEEEKKYKNALIKASEQALESIFSAHPNKEASPYSIDSLCVFLIEVGRFKGYLTLANDNSAPMSAQDFSNFRDAIIIGLQQQGIMGEVSKAHLLNPEVEDYPRVISEFTEFSLVHKNQGGSNYNVAFVKREVLQPTFSLSEKEDMYLVDIKVIPPRAPVNFDAFLYLPRNNRFVRYLKEGRSLSLKQAKRHTEEEDGQSKLYLPKVQEENFVKFFIQNTLNWEFTLHSKKDAA